MPASNLAPWKLPCAKMESCIPVTLKLFMLTVCQQSVGGASLTAVRGAEGSDVMDREDGEAAPSPTPRQGGMPCFDVVIDDSDESHEMAEEDVSTCAADGPADLLESVAIAHSSPPPPAAVQPVKVINSGIHFAPKISISDCSNTHVTFSISEGANAPTVQVEDGTVWPATCGCQFPPQPRPYNPWRLPGRHIVAADERRGWPNSTSQTKCLLYSQKR